MRETLHEGGGGNWQTSRPTPDLSRLGRGRRVETLSRQGPRGVDHVRNVRRHPVRGSTSEASTS